MNTKSRLIEKLKASKKSRDAYVASQINVGLPFQIRALRKQREWDQKKLAREAAMLQPRISTMESPGYGNPNLETLKRLASAFDVALVVRFVPFSELIRWSDRFSPDDFKVASFSEEVDQKATTTGNVVAINANYLATGANALGESRLVSNLAAMAAATSTTERDVIDGAGTSAYQYKAG